MEGPCGFAFHGARGQRFRHQPDGTNRGAQFVRDAGHELAFQGVKPLLAVQGAAAQPQAAARGEGGGSDEAGGPADFAAQRGVEFVGIGEVRPDIDQAAGFREDSGRGWGRRGAEVLSVLPQAQRHPGGKTGVRSGFRQAVQIRPGIGDCDFARFPADEPELPGVHHPDIAVGGGGVALHEGTQRFAGLPCVLAS